MKKQALRWRNKGKRKKLLEDTMIPGRVVTVFDTETTGLSETAKIIQFSAIKYKVMDDFSLSKVEDMDIYINPRESLSKTITKLTGITDEMLCCADDEERWGKPIFSFLEASDVLAGYNIPFDIRTVRQMANSLGVDIDEIECLPEIDVMEMARDWIPKKELDSHKLSSVADYLLPNTGFRFHSAIDDVIATAGVFEALFPLYRDFDSDMSDKEQTHLEYGKLIINPRKQSEQRIKLMLSSGELGDAFWDIKDKEWGCCVNTRAKQLFNRIDLEDLEEQFLQKYGYRFGCYTPDEVAKRWMDFSKQKKKEKQSTK